MTNASSLTFLSTTAHSNRTGGPPIALIVPDNDFPSLLETCPAITPPTKGQLQSECVLPLLQSAGDI